MTALAAKDIIAQPFTLPTGLVVKNRLAKGAMSEALGTPGNRMTTALPRLYRRWAEGGLGLSITGNVMVDRRALGEPDNVVLEDDRDLALLAQWAEAGRQHGMIQLMQLNHPGRQSPRGLNKQNIAPSAVPFRPEMAAYFAPPREMTGAEIEDVIQRFGRAAALARKAGFDGVQIHGAHGYLVSQFLSPLYNLRTDEWGGTPEKRRRFVLEVYKAIRAQVGKDFVVGIKLNSADFQRGGFSEDESLEVIAALAEAGIDLLEISGGTYEAPAMTGARQKDSTRQREAYFLDFAERVRARVKTPLMVTGGFRSLQGMAEAISSGAIDFVGLARPLAIEPDLPNRVLGGQDPEHQVRTIKTGIPMVDRMAIMEVAWYTRQLHRLAKGKDAVPDEHGLKSFAIYMAAGGWKTMRTRLRA